MIRFDPVWGYGHRKCLRSRNRYGDRLDFAVLFDTSHTFFASDSALLHTAEGDCISSAVIPIHVDLSCLYLSGETHCLCDVACVNPRRETKWRTVTDLDCVIQIFNRDDCKYWPKNLFPG